MTGDIILLVYSIIIPVSSVKHRKFPLRTNAIWVCNTTLIVGFPQEEITLRI